MSILNYIKHTLREEFLTADNFVVGRTKLYVEIYIKPTAREIATIIKAAKERTTAIANGIRFAVDGEATLYGWDGTVMHQYMGKYLEQHKLIPTYKWAMKFIYEPNLPDTIFIHMSDMDGADKPSLEWWNSNKQTIIDQLTRAIPQLKSVEDTRVLEGDVILWTKQDGFPEDADDVDVPPFLQKSEED